jgi:hypothetical protein
VRAFPVALLVFAGCADRPFALPSFAPAAASQAGAVPLDTTDLTICDLNGDARPDVVAAIPQGVAAFFNDGAGGMSAPVVTRIGEATFSVLCWDFDGDGKREVAAGFRDPTSTAVGLLTGPGDGSLGFRAGFFDGNDLEPRALALADVYGDSRPELIVHYLGFDPYHGTQLGVMPWNGDGFVVSSLTTVSPAASDEAAQIAYDDFDGDGHPDLIAATGGTLWFQMSRWPAITALATDGPFEAVATGDFDHDGRADVLAGGNETRLYRGHGTGSFDPPVVYQTGRTQRIAVGDLNLDGRPDAVLTDPDDQTLTLLINAPGGGFVSSTLAASGYPSSVGIADLNDDGWPDIIATNRYEALVFLNTTR